MSNSATRIASSDVFVGPVCGHVEGFLQNVVGRTAQIWFAAETFGWAEISSSILFITPLCWRLFLEDESDDRFAFFENAFEDGQAQ